MHAARAINKNREKREEKAKNETRRHSAISHIDWSIPRSPGTSLDAAARRAQHDDVSVKKIFYKKTEIKLSSFKKHNMKLV